MSALFITGGRGMSTLYPGLAFIEVLRAVNEGRPVITGENAGVESCVRAACNASA